MRTADTAAFLWAKNRNDEARDPPTLRPLKALRFTAVMALSRTEVRSPGAGRPDTVMCPGLPFSFKEMI